jgi:hypothetical protein
MDLHIYRNSQDRWYDLKSAAREHGAVLAANALTLEELVQRLTPDAKVASAGQRLLLLAEMGTVNNFPYSGNCSLSPVLPRYAFDAIDNLKGARVRSADLREAGADVLAAILDRYDEGLRVHGLLDPHDRRWLASTRVREGFPWLKKFQRVILHALYELTEAEFSLLRNAIEVLPDGGTVMLFNATANVRPTQFAEWTWQKFVQDESIAERAFPEFCRPSHPHRELLERLFVFEQRGASYLLDAEPWLQIFQASGRYHEIEKIGSDIADLLGGGATASDIAVVVRQIDSYGEMIEDVFTRYGIPHGFDTGVPLLRVPFIKYWFAFLDLVAGERSRDALARVMASAYYEPRLSPHFDLERDLAACGYIDRNQLPASQLARRKHLPLAVELERLENRLDAIERSADSFSGFVTALEPPPVLTERDRAAWRLLAEELRTVDRMAGRKTFAEFRRIASDLAGVRSIDRLGVSTVLPPGIPRVRVIHPRSLGYREYRWIFAPGLSDGEFPARANANPLLPDDVIDRINGKIWPRRLMSAKDRSRREPLFLFMMLDSARDRVTLTFPGSTLEGEPVYPSIYVGEITRHYAVCPIQQLSRELPPRENGEYLRRIADTWRENRIEPARAVALLGQDVVRRAEWERRGIWRGDVGRGVLRADAVWSPSELNSLAACPFIFLAKHRLGLRSREIPDFEVPASEVGILAHNILREFYSEPVPRAVEDARRRMIEIIDRKLSRADISGEGPYSVFDPGLWKIRRAQLVAVLLKYVEFAVKDSIAEFVTLGEYLDAPLPHARLGGALLSGRPDHVAVHRTDGRIDAIRVDDFKYSAASSASAKQLKDSFQIPIYAYLAQQALEADTGIQIEGRYLLLRSPSTPVVSHWIDETVISDIRRRVDELVGKVSDGGLHPDPADPQACPSCDYRRLCRYHGQ